MRLSDLADDVIEVDRVELRDGNTARSVAKIMRLVAEIRRRRFDLVIDLHSLSETNLLGYLARIPRRLYANRENRSLDRLANFRPRPPAEDKARHVADRYMDVLRPVGIEARAVPFCFDVSGIDEPPNATGVTGSIGIFPGAGHPSRCWSLVNFARLSHGLAAAGHRITVFLGPEESSLRSDISNTFPPSVSIVDGLTLSGFIRVVSHVDLFICNDTGPMHLAACAGVPVVLLMDERAPMTYLPLTDKLVVVRHRKLADITVDEVMNASMRALEGQYDKRDLA